jgi:hypothetical protein
MRKREKRSQKEKRNQKEKAKQKKLHFQARRNQC